jgi:hypothetical protein
MKSRRRAIRRVVRRQLLLGESRVVGAVRLSWVRLVGLRLRRGDRESRDPATGRTSVHHLEAHRIGPKVWPHAEALIERGVDPSELAKAIVAVTDTSAEAVAERLRETAPQMLREHRAVNRGMRRRLLAIWGPAFDTMYQVYVCAEELGSDLQQLHGGSDDLAAEALLGLHARACLLLAEIHSAMTSGFPLAAWARARTLHETAVIASVLSTFGRKEEYEDLARRFLDHASIDEAKDLELESKSGVPLDPTITEAVFRRRSEMVDRYGAGFAWDFGWARPLFPDLRPKDPIRFAALERLSESGLSRLDYSLASHHVHSSAWTVELNNAIRGGTWFRMTGPTNIGFAEPAGVALSAMEVSIFAAVQGIPPDLPEPMHLVGARAISLLALETLSLMASAQALVDKRELKYQRRRAPVDSSGRERPHRLGIRNGVLARMFRR